MISTAENPWPLITFNLRKRKKWGRGRGETYWREIKKNTLFFPRPCVWEGYYLCLAVRESKGPAGTLTHIFWFEFLVTASNGRLLQLVNNRADHLLILQPQLLMNDLHIPHWIHSPLNVDDILILKSTCSDRTQTHRESVRVKLLFFSTTLFYMNTYSTGNRINVFDFLRSNVKQWLDLAQKIISFCRECGKNKHPPEKAQWESQESHNKYNKIFRNIFNLSFQHESVRAVRNQLTVSK